MKVAVLSGKGGSGKTLVAVNLAATAGKATYVDCDVEEPNGHLDPAISLACDEGKVETVRGQWMDHLATHLEGKDENDMKIAVAADDNLVSGHFGHCEAFQLFETIEGKIIRTETLPNPGHKPGFLPNYLHEKGINVIISGGMGGGAVDLFNENDIEVVTGAMGDAKEVVERYLLGALSSTGSVCHEHAHHDSCGQ